MLLTIEDLLDSTERPGRTHQVPSVGTCTSRDMESNSYVRFNKWLTAWASNKTFRVQVSQSGLTLWGFPVETGVVSFIFQEGKTKSIFVKKTCGHGLNQGSWLEWTQDSNTTSADPAIATSIAMPSTGAWVYQQSCNQSYLSHVQFC